jgi:catechol 2,3-dioxygenase-like lactoylglutathione lyase family enzyme
MLPTFPGYATLPTGDVARLRQFYEGLGFEVIEETSAGVYVGSGDGTYFAVTKQSGQASGTHTQLGFRVRQIQAVVADLRSRGAVFEEYETPRTVDGIAEVPVGRAAWFKDPDGNLIGLVEIIPGH